MNELCCYRCGTALAALSLPLARLDLCPNCNAYLHVCKMCMNYAPARPSACSEEDAIEVGNKTGANFCDYFKPNPGAITRDARAAEQEAEAKLASLFGDDGGSTADKTAGSSPNSSFEEADALFRK